MTGCCGCKDCGDNKGSIEYNAVGAARRAAGKVVAENRTKKKCSGWRKAFGFCKDESSKENKTSTGREEKPNRKKEPALRVIRRQRINNNCWAYNIKRSDGSDFWKVLTYQVKVQGVGRGKQSERDEAIIAAKDGKIFPDRETVINWCREQSQQTPLTSKPSTGGGTAVPVVEDKEEQGRTQRKGCSEQCKFMIEMVHEGVELTALGKSVEKTIAQAYLPDHPTCYRKAMMGFFGGDKCQEGKFWRRGKRNKNAAKVMRSTCCNEYAPETLNAETFSAYDPVNDFLPRYRYPSDSAWSPKYNPAAPYRQMDQQAVATYPCHHDEKTRAR